uniref:Uncharacterized protein n=1 Tax=Anguilla anguilla TaxID=7936 RepID=A0A0E9Q6N2_ANGAN
MLVFIFVKAIVKIILNTAYSEADTQS